MRLHVVKLTDGDVIEVPSIEGMMAVEAAGTKTAKLFYLEEVGESELSSDRMSPSDSEVEDEEE